MLTIARLFGKSPFAPLQSHMDKVCGCIEKLSEIFALLPKKEQKKISVLVEQLGKLEHEADLTKNDIRNHLPRSLFMPIDRSHFLDILSIQDSIADKTEDIGLLLTLRPLETCDNLEEGIQIFFQESSTVFFSARNIIREIDELLESSFGGIEAEKVKEMVEETAKKQYQAKVLQNKLLATLFSKAEGLSSPSFYLWLKVIEEIGLIAALSEKLANRIRMVLELK